MTSASTYSDQPAPAPDAQPEEMPLDRAAQQRLALAEVGASPPPPLEEAAILHGQLQGDEAVVVVVTQTALAEVDAHANSNLDCEVGGALMGRVYRAGEQVYVEVVAALPVVTDDHGPVHFTFTADAWAQLHRERADKHANLDIVGWFHTHPDLGVFYSSDDVVVHSAAFTQPWHIGLVVDPIRQEMSFFGWKAGELDVYSGFYELCDQKPISILHWRMVRTAVWDHPYEYEAETGSQVYLPSNRMPGLPSLKPYLGFIVGLLGFLLSFFLLVGWVVPLSQEVSRLETMVVVLADRALANSNAALCPDPRLRILSPLAGQSVPVGTSVDILGTASYPERARYQVNIRPAGAETWTLLSTVTGDETLGELAVWDTAATPPGAYEVRLTAVDRNNVRVANSPMCAIPLEVMP